MTDTTDIKALSDRLRAIAKTATPGKWLIDSHGGALVALSHERIRTVLKPERLREKPYRDENTGDPSYWPNDSDASWIAAAQPQNIIALLDQLKTEVNRGDGNAKQLNAARKQASAARKGFDEQYLLREQAEARVGELEGIVARQESAANISERTLNMVSYDLQLERAANEELLAEIIALRRDIESYINIASEQVPVGFTSDDALADVHCGQTSMFGPLSTVGGIPLYARPQKPAISKEKLCDWLEDNFDIDDSQRDAFVACFALACCCEVKDNFILTASAEPSSHLVDHIGDDNKKLSER